MRIISDDDDDVRAAPDKPLIDSITVEGSAASVHFLSSEHRSPRNPGTDFYVEYTQEEHAGTASWLSVFLCRVVQWCAYDFTLASEGRERGGRSWGGAATPSPPARGSGGALSAPSAGLGAEP